MDKRCGFDIKLCESPLDVSGLQCSQCESACFLSCIWSSPTVEIYTDCCTLTDFKILSKQINSLSVEVHPEPWNEALDPDVLPLKVPSDVISCKL